MGSRSRSLGSAGGKLGLGFGERLEWRKSGTHMSDSDVGRRDNEAVDRSWKIESGVR